MLLFRSIIMLNVRYLCTTNVTVIIPDEMPYHFEEARFQSIYNERAEILLCFLSPFHMYCSVAATVNIIVCISKWWFDVCVCVGVRVSVWVCVFVYKWRPNSSNLAKGQKTDESIRLKMVSRLPEALLDHALSVAMCVYIAIGRRDSSWWIDHFTNDIFTTATI